jgi:AraC-like DNA-binding protein
MEPRVAALAANGVLGLIGQCGGDADRIIGAARLTMRDLDDPGAKLDLRRYCDLFEHAAAQTGLAHFGLHFGTAYRIEALGTLGALLLNTPTIGAALQSLCAYFPSLQEHSTLTLEPHGAYLALRYQIRDGRITARRQDAELSMGMFIALLRRALGAEWGPEEVQFEHLRLAERAAHERLLNAPVTYAAPANVLLIRRTDLAAPMPGANASLLLQLHAALHAQLAQVRPDDFLGSVAQKIRDGFAAGDASIAAVAAAMGMSRAGLYRRLKAAGSDYSALTGEVRRGLALMYAGDAAIPFTEIAALLGYSELSAFSRAFKTWTGLAPQAWRTQKRA